MDTEIAVAAVSDPARSIVEKIYVIRDCRVMLDMDLASLYGVETKALNRAVKRNVDRFPSDFMFQLLAEEAEAVKNLRRQFGASSWGGRRYLPYAFTEQGEISVRIFFPGCD